MTDMYLDEIATAFDLVEAQGIFIVAQKVEITELRKDLESALILVKQQKEIIQEMIRRHNDGIN